MSTIFGLYYRNIKSIEKNTILWMEKALSYWKFDDHGIWQSDFVMLGHRMLWNTPESKSENLPLVLDQENKTLIISSDARIDNRDALAKELILPHRPLSEIGDSEFILAAYLKWGEACAKHLLGDFVFVIWDEKKQHLFCARDYIGIKSFYYYLSDDLFIFSNDIRGLISHPLIAQQYNDRAIAMFLSEDFGFHDSRDTFFEEIKKLPAATSITITRDNAIESVYWDIQNIPKVQYRTYEAYVKKLRELLLDAVKVRLRTDYPIASHLSGGIDSSGIAVLAAREEKKKGKPLYAFNWVEMPDKEYDPYYHEWGFASALARQENIKQKNIKLTPEFIMKKYDEIDITKDDLSDFGEYLVRNEAEKFEIRTLLTGWGGDELISYDGYAYLSGLFWTGNFLKGIREIDTLYQEKKYRYLHIAKRALREILYPLYYKQMSGLYQKDKSKENNYEFTQDLFASFAKKQTFEILNFFPGVHNEQKALFTQGHLLQRIESWSSSAHEKKLEYSYPLLDKRIVEFALAIPEDMFALKEGHQRYLYRSTISEFLPQNISWKAKIAELEHGKAWVKLWNEALILWINKNENIIKNKNAYIDRLKIIKRLKVYSTNKQNKVEDNIGSSSIVASILVSNLKSK